MPPDDPIDDSPAGSSTDNAAIDAAVAAVDAQLAQSSDAVRSTPEFRALAQQLRKTARENGVLKAAQVRDREAAETARLAAEAQRQAALESQLNDILGADGIAAYQGLAELGATDPVAAARKFAELTRAGQTAGAAATTIPATSATPEGVIVPAQTPPPPSGGVDANAPLLVSQTEDIEALTASLDKRFADVVERNQNVSTRNRVTMRERADAAIGFLGSAYVKTLGRR